MFRLKPEPSGEWEPRRACWPDLSRTFETRQDLRRLKRWLDRHNAKLAPRWFKVSSEADAKAWDQEVKARLISTDESEPGRDG